MSAFRVLAAAMLIAALGAGCAKVQAKTEPALPELVPPPPPPRVVEIYQDEPIPTVEPSPAETALTPPANKPPAKPPAQRAENAPKPEPPRIEPERPTSPPLSLTLKPAPGSESSTEASIRTLLQRAGKDLGRVNYGSLSTDRKAQYDQSRRFMEQAEDALRVNNLAYAGKLADKAATMAGLLVR